MVRWKVSEALGWTAWHLAIGTAIFLVGFWATGAEFAPRRELLSPAMMAGVFFLFSLLSVPAGRSVWMLGIGLAATIAVLVALFLVLVRLKAEPPAPVFASLAIAVLAGGLVPHLGPRPRIAGTGILALALGASVLARNLPDPNRNASLRTIQTALYRVSVERFEGLVDTPEQTGGALDVLADGMLLADGDSKFYWLEGSAGLAGRTASRLTIPSPANRAAQLADFDDPADALKLRLTDIIFRSADDKTGTLFAAHQYWNSEARCYTNRVSSIGIARKNGEPAANGDWQTVFETAPCLSGAEPFEDIESGGKLALDVDGSLLLTVGDFNLTGLDGTEPVAQTEPSSYGRIWRIRPEDSEATVVSKGHRNPQGLVVARDGRIWASEHGPKGGDEINLIRTGGNYGWPYATYGTSYGGTSWPLDPDGINHKDYDAPALSFVPSIATSALIEYGSRMFPRWNGDLLVATLRTQAIHRLRLAGDRIVYSERIFLRERIRDIAELPDGAIVAWVDSGLLLELRTSAVSKITSRTCVGCHAPATGPAVGPPLDDVLGRKIAGVAGFEYTQALSTLDGVWTPENLARFLNDPAKFAPGTTMMDLGLTKDEIDQIIAELSE